MRSGTAPELLDLRVRRFLQMAKSIIVVPGLGQLDLTTLSGVAAEFGWTVQVAHDLRQTAELFAPLSAVALFATHDAVGAGFSWLEILGLLRQTLPDIRLVVCHGFGDAFDWPELSAAGAFHALRLPLQEDELRQSLGFIWEAEKRLMIARAVRAIAAA
jgi:DNA-binding NtrC family response regulator